MKRLPINLGFMMVLAVALAAPVAGAATFLWTGASGVDLNWPDTANWSPATGSPGPADTAIFGANATTGNAATVNSMVSVNTTIAALTFTNSVNTAWNVADIPSGVTLTATNVTVGGLSVATGAPVTLAAVTDAGTLVIDGNLTVGNNDTGSTAGSSGTLDLSGLGNFVYNAPAGTIALSTGARSTGNLNLASVSNQITAATINDNTAQTSSSGTGNLKLGSGTNIINVGAFNIGAGRGSSTVSFPDSTGGLRLRGTGGTDTNLANVTIGNRNNSGGTGNSISGTLSLSGHPVDLRLGTLTLGVSGSNPSGTATGNGTLSFDTGTVYASNIVMAVTAGGTSAGVQANGTINVGAGTGTLVIGPGGMSMVNQASASGPATGTLNVTDGTVICSNSIVKTSLPGTANITFNGGTLMLPSAATTVGTAAMPIDNVTLNGATLDLGVDGNVSTASIDVTAVGASGTTINITSVANLLFQKTIHLISYNSGNGDPFGGLTLTPLTGGYTGALVDNPGSVDLMITPPNAGVSVLWVGAVGSTANGNWDAGGTANWLNGATPTTYADPDLVHFDDTANNATVNVTTAVGPGSFTVTNFTLNYTFTGSGSITGEVALAKSGPAGLTLAESGGDSFTGGIQAYGGTLLLDDAGSSISGGLTIASGATVQIGNNDNHGNLPAGALDDEGTLIFDRSDNVQVSAAIPGGGALTQAGSGILSLSGSNSYTGVTTVTGGTLALTNAGAIANSAQVGVANATLDLSGLAGPTTIGSLSLNNAAVDVNAAYLQAGLNVNRLNLGGAGNAINIRALPPVAYYPTTIMVLQAAGGISGYNFTLGSLPAGSSGTLSESADQTAVLLTLTSGPISARPYVVWNGGPSTAWSEAPNWQTPGVPTTTDNVIFNYLDAQGSSALSAPGGGAGALAMSAVNNVVDTSTTMATLAYTNLAGSYQNTYINDGVTLTIASGATNTILAAGSSTSDFGTSASEFVTIAGPKGRLNVNNTNATVFVGLESAGSGAAQATLDMSALGVFNATVGSLAVGAMATTAVLPSGVLYLAETNTISAVGGSPNEGGQSESLSLMVGQTGKNGTTESFLYLGQVNIINANSIGVSIAKQNAEIEFNPIFTGSNSVVFRGGDGVGPVSSWSIGDGLAQTGSSTSPTGTADFTGGTANALVTTMYIGRTPNASGAHPATGTLTLGAGMFSVSNLYVGYQAYSVSDNGVGTVNVTGPGTLSVNTLNLGLVTGGAGASTTTGTIQVNDGTLAVNAVVCGNGGGNNAINLTGGRLIVTNSVGTPAAPLTMLSLDGATLQLNVNAGAGAADIVATTVATGAASTINLASVTGAGGTLQLPLISYTGSDPYSALTLGTYPAGYNITLVDNTANSSIDAYIVPTIKPTPHFTSISVSGPTLTLKGANGAFGGQYVLLGTTNLAAPLNQWLPVLTNNFGPDGSLNLSTNIINPARPREFFEVVQ